MNHISLVITFLLSFSSAKIALPFKVGNLHNNNWLNYGDVL